MTKTSVAEAEAVLYLHETFRAYVAASGAATRAFIRYQVGEVTEAEVHRLQAAERQACDAHIEAMNARGKP